MCVENFSKGTTIKRLLGWLLAEPKAGILAAVVSVSIHEENTSLLLHPVLLLVITTEYPFSI
jgi:hypothetical protein